MARFDDFVTFGNQITALAATQQTERGFFEYNATVYRIAMDVA
jgi:hypothetical protein